MPVARSFPFASTVAAAGHLGVWPALYAGATLTCFAQLAGIWRPSRMFACATASVIFTTMGVYLLDRVKLADVLLDPADRAAEPERYAFLLPHTHRFRAVAALALVLGAACGLGVSHWAPLATGLGIAGVVSYAAHPRRVLPRPKDLVWLKNAYIAAGMTAFTAAAALAAAPPIDSPSGWSAVVARHVVPVFGAAVFVAGRVLIDAALCDTDDEATDRRFGTATAATTAGGSRVRVAATVAGLLLCGGLACVSAIAPAARLRWISAGVTGIAALALWRPAHVKDFIDLRFPLEAAACLLAALVV